MSLDVGQAGGIPNGAVFTVVTSGNVAAATAAAALLAVTGRTTYLLGFTFQALGATATSVVSWTIAGLLNGTWTFPYVVPAGVAVQAPTLYFTFGSGIPGVISTNITVSMPSLGAGNTNASMAAWGFVL